MEEGSIKSKREGPEKAHHTALPVHFFDGSMLTFIPVLFVSPSLSPNPTSVLSLLAHLFCPACTSRAHLPVLYVCGLHPRSVRTVCTVPLIDSIDGQKYTIDPQGGGDEDGFARGAWDWSMLWKRVPLGDREKQLRNSHSEPYRYRKTGHTSFLPRTVVYVCFYILYTQTQVSVCVCIYCINM